MKNISIIKNKLTVTFLTLGTVLFIGCNPHQEHENSEQHENVELENIILINKNQYEMSGIKLGKIEKRNLSNTLKVSGILDAPPQNLITISSPYGGFVSKTNALEGMKVKKGDELAIMEHPNFVQLQQDYIEKKSQLEFLAEEFKRQEELDKEKVNSSKIFQKAKADFISAQIQVAGLKEKLAFIGIDSDKLNSENISRKVQIKAPIDGYISKMNVNVGKYVNASDIIFEIVNTEHLHAELTVFEKDIAKLKVGQKISFTMPNNDETERFASIYLIGKKIDKDRAVKVHAHLEIEDSNLLPGMYIQASIELDQNKVNTVPEQSIITQNSKHYIFSLQQLTSDTTNETFNFEMIEIQRGISSNGYVEINSNRDLSGINLVTHGSYALLSKLLNKDDVDGGHGH